MTTPFTPGIPTTGQSLGITKFPIQNNFTAIVEDMDTNHVAIGAVGRGKHKFMQMPEQAAAPTTAANEGALYTKEAGSETNLYWRQESTGGEFGWIYKKGAIVIPARVFPAVAPGPQLIIDFTGFPTCFGYINLRDNTSLSQVNDFIYVFYHASTNTIKFGGINSVGSGGNNTGSATVHFGATAFTYSISGTQVTIGYSSGLYTGGFSTNWAFVANIFPES